MGTLFLPCKKTAAQRRHAEGGKESTGYSGNVHPRRLSPAGNGGYSEVIGGQPGKGVVLCKEILEIGFSQVRPVTVGHLFPDAHQLLRMRIGERTEQHCIRYREYRRR